MTDLAMWLAGVSFTCAVLAVIIAIAEHYRAVKAERQLSVALAKDNHGHCQENLARATDIASLARGQVEIWKSIHALAAASTPPTYSTEKPYIVVPGPRTRQ